MPTVEITQQQADALARGENVTLAAPAKSEAKRFLFCYNNGSGPTLWVYHGHETEASTPDKLRVRAETVQCIYDPTGCCASVWKVERPSGAHFTRPDNGWAMELPAK
jgi:hypothetical protein